MVKKFRRAAAGIEEQLPSDLRTPSVLSQTCDYLFNDVVANAPELGRVHHFVWDRTRAIRNDFTILQVSSPPDLKHAVDCLERIARFHIVSLHQMASVKEKDFQYDWQQDREQLDRTLVSLMQYYDDSRGKIVLPNEPEFRAYLIVFQLQDPDMEDRVQSWPQDVLQHPRIRKAMKLYAAAGDTASLQGPLRPAATLPIAQQNWQRFWTLVASKRTSYLTACVAEINFNLIRRVALQALTRSVNQRATADFTSEEICSMLEFNDGYEAEEYLACYNVTFVDRDEGRFADISALKSRQVLPEPSPAPPKQLKSEMVEAKRFGRSLPAVISGFSVKEAQDNDMVDEDEMGFTDADMGEGEAFGDAGNGHASSDLVNDDESLFMPDTAKSKSKASPFGVDFDAPSTSVFGQLTQQPKADTSFFGKPSTGTFGIASGGGEAAPGPTGDSAVPKSSPFNFLSGSTAPTGHSSSSSFSFAPSPVSNAFSGFNPPPKSDAPAPSNTSGESIFATKKDNPSSGFTGFNFTPTTSGVSNNAAPAATTSPVGQPKQVEAQLAKRAWTPSPFMEDGDNPPPDNSPQVSEFPIFTSEPTPSHTTPPTFTPPPAPPNNKPEPPTFSFGTPKTRELEATKLPTAPFATAAKPEEPKAAPSLMPEAATTTSHATSNAKPASPPKPTSTPLFSFTTSNNSTASARRASTSDNFNRPAKPSPLAQSYTAASDVNDSVQLGVNTTAQSLNKDPTTLPCAQKPIAKPRPAEREQPLPEPDFASLIRDIARNVTLTPDIGLFDQFLEYHLGKVITNAQEKVHFERINAEADEFRAFVLARRFGRLWRDVCRRKRLARQGRERRKRNQQRLLESRNQAPDAASVADSASNFGKSQFGSTMGSTFDRPSRQEEVDKMFQQSTTTGRWSRMAKQDEQPKAGSKRPTSSHSMVSLESNQKRVKGTSHVDDGGRITKLAPAGIPYNGALKRSSFRDTLSDNPPVASTTKSNYFRLKAMGRAHIYDLAPTYPRKRQRAEVTSSPAPGSFRQLVEQSPPERASSPASKLRRTTSNSSVRSRQTAEETDAVITRARAAREALRDGAALLGIESGTPDPLRQSTGSQVLYDSPSMERARVDARWRASQNTDFGSSRRAEVPAYRLRESKFVPRENYAKAIDRAREMRQSRAGSRPESRIEVDALSKPAEASENRQAQVDLTGPSTVQDPLTASGNLPQPHWPTAAQSQLHEESTLFGTMGQVSNTMHSNSLSATNFGLDKPQLSEFGNHISQPSQSSGFTNHDFQFSQFSTDPQDAFGQPEAHRASYQMGVANHPTEEDPLERSNVQVDNLDDELQFEGIAMTHINGTRIDHAANGRQSECLSADEAVGRANPDAALANGQEDEDEEGEEEQPTLGHANSFGVLADEEEEDYDQYNYDDNQPGAYPGAVPNGEYDDEEEDDDDEGEEDGDIEDEDGEEFDEDESDIDEDEDDADSHQFLDPHMMSQPKPYTNVGFATQAAAESEVIELSD
jgi:hypothetical protein